MPAIHTRPPVIYTPSVMAVDGNEVERAYGILDGRRCVAIAFSQSDALALCDASERAVDVAADLDALRAAVRPLIRLTRELSAEIHRRDGDTPSDDETQRCAAQTVAAVEVLLPLQTSQRD